MSETSPPQDMSRSQMSNDQSETQDLAINMQDVVASGLANSYEEAFRFVTEGKKVRENDPPVTVEGKIEVDGEDIYLVHCAVTYDRFSHRWILQSGYGALSAGCLERISMKLGPHWVPAGKIAVDLNHQAGDEEEFWYPGLDSEGKETKVVVRRLGKTGWIPFSDNVIIPTRKLTEEERRDIVMNMRL